jgi:hypothetical protein
MAATPDGGYIVTAEKSDLTTIIVRFDNENNILWIKHSGEEPITWFTAIAAADNNHFAAVGLTNTNNEIPYWTHNGEELSAVIVGLCVDEEEEEAFEIWNWADLAYLNVMMEEPGQTEWKSYGEKAILMQSLGAPDGTPEIDYGIGIDCPYETTTERRFGYYGYKNYIEEAGYNSEITLNDTDLQVGFPAKPLGRFAFDTDNTGWIPIANDVNLFNGEFDGNEKTITSLWIYRTENNQGLFSTVANAFIHDLKIEAEVVYG